MPFFIYCKKLITYIVIVVFGQNFGRFSCLICGDSSIQDHSCFYSLTVSIFSVLFRGDMDTYRWNIVSATILPSHTYKRTLASKAVQA